MPFIKTTTNINIPDEKRIILQDKLNNIIKLMGKDSYWLMLEFEDNKNLVFQNSNDGACFVDVRCFGQLSGADEMTKEITDILSCELNILPNRIYIAYKEYDTWGYNGSNF